MLYIIGYIGCYGTQKKTILVYTFEVSILLPSPSVLVDNMNALVPPKEIKTNVNSPELLGQTVTIFFLKFLVREEGELLPVMVAMELIGPLTPENQE